MPNAAAHNALGAGTGALAANHYISPLLTEEEQKEHGPVLLVSSLVAGGIGGRIPDWLEPAIHPKHRSVYHSVAAGCVVALGLGLTIKAVTELPRLRSGRKTSHTQQTPKATRNSGLSLKQIAIATVVIAALVGILSHLAVDSGTPDGLPMVR